MSCLKFILFLPPASHAGLSRSQDLPGDWPRFSHNKLSLSAGQGPCCAGTGDSQQGARHNLCPQSYSFLMSPRAPEARERPPRGVISHRPLPCSLDDQAHRLTSGFRRACACGGEGGRVGGSEEEGACIKQERWRVAKGVWPH